MLKKKIQALFHPEQYHGWGRRKRFFEGWYYKIVNKKEDQAFAFIPGIAMDEQGKQQAFVQVLDGKKMKAEYHQFAAEDFVPQAGKFELAIGANYFSSTTLRLALPGATGELNFTKQVPWSSSWYSPGIMGPFSFVPFMQCYHGILSMDHQIEGQLTIEGTEIDFTGGRGYLEKDWGHSFPSAYIWMQSNHFSESGISLKASVAKIPWMGTSFVGFIAGIWLRDRLIEFTTYNFTRLRRSFADQEAVALHLENRRYRLQIRADREAATELASPIIGFMEGRVEESMTAKLEVALFDKKTQQFILQDVGRNAGLEVAGKISEIMIG